MWEGSGYNDPAEVGCGFVSALYLHKEHVTFWLLMGAEKQQRPE